MARVCELSCSRPPWSPTVGCLPAETSRPPRRHAKSFVCSGADLAPPSALEQRRSGAARWQGRRWKQPALSKYCWRDRLPSTGKTISVLRDAERGAGAIPAFVAGSPGAPCARAAARPACRSGGSFAFLCPGNWDRPFVRVGVRCHLEISALGCKFSKGGTFPFLGECGWLRSCSNFSLSAPPGSYKTGHPAASAPGIFTARESPGDQLCQWERSWKQAIFSEGSKRLQKVGRVPRAPGSFTLF